MHFYLANTDLAWFDHLLRAGGRVEDVNFWKPSGKSFGALSMGEPLVFRLKSPVNMIGGVGFFQGFARMSLGMAWEAFGEGNGVGSLEALRDRIHRYRSKIQMGTPSGAEVEIGCIALVNCIFFRPEDYVPMPGDWSDSIVMGKRYDASAGEGRKVWEAVASRLTGYAGYPGDLTYDGPVQASGVVGEPNRGYGELRLSSQRIGQGAFRVKVVQAYKGRCALTGESVLDALEAAHIQDYRSGGPNAPSNGLLLRADLHKLFDRGHFSLTDDLRVVGSPVLQQAQGYSGLLGLRLDIGRVRLEDRPALLHVQWHRGRWGF